MGVLASTVTESLNASTESLTMNNNRNVKVTRASTNHAICNSCFRTIILFASIFDFVGTMMYDWELRQYLGQEWNFSITLWLLKPADRRLLRICKGSKKAELSTFTLDLLNEETTETTARITRPTKTPLKLLVGSIYHGIRNCSWYQTSFPFQNRYVSLRGLLSFLSSLNHNL